MKIASIPQGLTAADIDNLRHMLGATDGYPEEQWGWRNHFACGDAHVRSMNRLLAAGLVIRGYPYETDFYYHATAAGKQLVGVTNEQY